MPTNLPPEYHEAEKLYREATTPEQKIARLEEMISTIPKHKGTDKLRADYRRRLSKMREAASQASKRTRGAVSPYRIDREGAGQLVIIGPTNVGKSSLVVSLTNASPEVSSAPFTTWQPTPGMMPVENIQVQLVDTPPLNPDYMEPDFLDLIRRADLILLVVDLQMDPLQQLEDALHLLETHHIIPLHRQGQYGDDRRLRFVPLLLLVNKHDGDATEEDFQIFLELLEEDCPLLAVSTLSGRNLEYLKQVVVQRLGIIRVYSQAPGQKPQFDSPFVLQEGDTVADFAGQVHQDFYKNLKTARVWGTGVYDGQMVSREHILHDGDIVELRI
jgi:ribosome-interacting GTPase 1